MTITFKRDGYDLQVICNKAETLLLISKTIDGRYTIYFKEEELKTLSYLNDAKELVIKLLELGIGRNYKNERY